MRRTVVLFSCLSLLACSDDESPAGGGGAGGDASGGGGGSPTAGGGGAGGSGPVTEDFEAGGDRPVTVKLPAGYSPETPAPLLILLHGYSASGAIQESYFQLGPVASANGLVFAAPDGTVDVTDEQFWNATEACCDFGGTSVDDSAYLAGLIAEISSKVSIDPARIYFVGHSNGGFMSYRMACDHAGTVAAIVSLAGATFVDPADCGASEPVSVLQIHGDLDDTILYDGGETTLPYPSASQTVAYWAELAGCDPTPVGDATMLDLDSAVAGSETTAQNFQGCAAGIDVALWTLAGSGHIPLVTTDFREGVVAWLLAHPKL